MTLALLLSALMCLAILPVGAMAKLVPGREIYSGTCGESLTWTLDTSTGVLDIIGSGAMQNYSSTGAPWNSHANEVLYINIGEAVTTIGNAAFWGCSQVTSIVIPDSVTRIGKNAFEYCTVLSSVILGNSVSELGASIFGGCYALVSIDLPASVETIDSGTFRGCHSLEAINTASDNPYFKSLDGILLTKDGSTLLCFPCGKDCDYTIPSGVIRIGDYSFYGCELLHSVHIPEGVAAIGRYAFQLCTAMQSVNIPSSVTEIGFAAFYSCRSLTSIVIPGSITVIPRSAFINCSGLTSVTLPENLEGIGKQAFWSCSSLTEITFPDSLQYLGELSFNNCASLSSATFLGGKPLLWEPDDYKFVSDPDSSAPYPARGGDDELPVFYGCAPDFRVYYTASHASEWAPNGETYWYDYYDYDPYPIYMIPDPQPVLPGDVDGNGSVNANDALTVLRAALGLVDEVGSEGDVNGDGVVNANDALMILRAALGLITF